MSNQKAAGGWGLSWLALTVALALHVWDEAAHDFLAVYNPAVTAIRDRLSFLPLPTFTFRTWLTGLIVGLLVLFSTSVLAFRGTRWFRYPSFAFAILMIANGLMHIIGSVYYSKAMPGIYSSPVLMASSLWVLIEVRRASNSPA